jgi:hypothetical protein
MDNWPLVLAISAVVVHLLAFALWTTLYTKINKGLWLIVTSGFLLMAVHRVAEACATAPIFVSISACGIAYISLFAVLSVHKHIRVVHPYVKHTKQHLAEQITEHVLDLKARIKWYEDQSRANGLTQYPDK